MAFSCQKPKSSSTSITVILGPLTRLGALSKIVIARQILFGESQSVHNPVETQGSSTRLWRFALRGPATFLRRFKPASTSFTILFFPATTITFLGPNIIEATLLPVLSMFTNFPSFVTALLLQRNTSELCASIIKGNQSLTGMLGCQWWTTRFPRRVKASIRPSSRIVIEPPTPTLAFKGISSKTLLVASALDEATRVLNWFLSSASWVLDNVLYLVICNPPWTSYFYGVYEIFV